MKAALIKAVLRRNNQATIPKSMTDLLGMPKDAVVQLAVLGWYEGKVFHQITNEELEKLQVCDRCVVLEWSEKIPKEE